MFRNKFDVNLMSDEIIEQIIEELEPLLNRIRNCDQMLTFIHQIIEKYDNIFDRKSIEDKKLLMKECCCYIRRLSTKILLNHDIDLTLNDCVIGVTSDENDTIHDNIDNNDDSDSESVDNTCVKCDKHIVVVSVKNELENDNFAKNRGLTKEDERFAELEMWEMANEKPNKNIYSGALKVTNAGIRKIMNKSKRRSTNKTGFPKIKKKFSDKKLTYTKKVKPSSDLITDNFCDLSKIHSNKDNNKCDRNSKRKDVKSNSGNDNESSVKLQSNLTLNVKNDKTKGNTKNKINKQPADKCHNEANYQNNNLNSEDDDRDNEDHEEKHVKFMGSTFRARDLMKKCVSCNPKCELDELTLAFYVMMNCENDDDLPRDLQKHCRIDSSSNSESSDCDNNDQQISENKNTEQIVVNSCGDFTDDLDIVDVNEIYAAEKEWFSNDVLNDGLNEYLVQTSNSTFQTLPFDPSLQSFVSQPSTSGYGKTAFGPIINNVHTMSQQIIINSVMPPVSSIPSSDFSPSELPADLLDIVLDHDLTDTNIACNSDINSNFDANTTTINNAGNTIIIQSEITSGKRVAANDEHTLDESLNTSTQTVVSNDKNYKIRCKYCVYTCERRNNMINHCRTVHPGVPIFTIYSTPLKSPCTSPIKSVAKICNQSEQHVNKANNDLANNAVVIPTKKAKKRSHEN